MGKYYKKVKFLVDGKEVHWADIQGENNRRIAAAKESGSKTYTRVNACKRGHHEHYVNGGTCKQCALDRMGPDTIHKVREKLYGVTRDNLDAIREAQSNRCPICLETLASDNRVNVDHCHDTGLVRGLLCRECNLGIGHLKDDYQNVEMAARYLLKSLSMDTPAMRILYGP